MKVLVVRLPTGELMLHPDGMCKKMHNNGKQCICELGGERIYVEVPHFYFIDEVPELVDTGYRLAFMGKDYTVLSYE